MRTPNLGSTIGCVLLTALLSSMGAHAAVTDTKKPVHAQPVSVVADTQVGARQGTVNVGGINWACSGKRCSTLIMSSTVAAPLAMCQGLAREVGAIQSFTLANRPLNGNELQQCNSVAPAAAIPSMKMPQGAGLPPATPLPGVGLPPMQAPPRNAPVTGLATPQAPAPLMADLAKKPPATKEVNRKASPYPENWTEPDMRADKSPVFEDMRNELRKNDQPALPSAKEPSTSFQLPSKSGGGFIPQVAMSPTTPNPAKKPSGKGSTPAPQPPPPAEAEAPTAPGSRSYPMRIRTEGLSVTGTGTEVRLPVTSKRIRTEGLTVTGAGTSTEVRLPVTSIKIRTESLTVTGAGSAR